jgi:hypothetical protein
MLDQLKLCYSESSSDVQCCLTLAIKLPCLRDPCSLLLVLMLCHISLHIAISLPRSMGLRGVGRANASVEVPKLSYYYDDDDYYYMN